MYQENKVVKIKDIVLNQIPEFILSENSNLAEFLKQYYVSQEFQGSSVDLVENLISYKTVDAFNNATLYSNTTLTKDLEFFDDEIFVDSVDGYPNEYGLLKVDDEIITYTGIERGVISNTAEISVGSTVAIISNENITEDYIGREFKIKHYIENFQGEQIQNPIIVGVSPSTNSVFLSSVGIASTSVIGYNIDNKYNYEVDLPKFTGCIRGFSGIDSLSQENNPEFLNFSKTESSEHQKGSNVTNLSVLFIKEFFKKIKYQFIPGFEEIEFDPRINVPNFISESRSFYETKGTDECYKILFKVLYGEDVKIIKPDEFTFKPSDDKWTICESFVCELISGDPTKIVGQTLFQNQDLDNNILPASGSIYSVNRFYLNNKTYYKVNLFSGYSNNLSSNGSIFGTFVETPKTYVVEDTLEGSSIITVDSTIGFKTSGTIVVNGVEISYTDKTINQFLNCSGIVEFISPKTELYGNNYVYSYENNLNIEVKLRIINSLSGIESSDILYAAKGDYIKVNNLGSVDDNAFTKSLIYNLPTTVYSGILTSNLQSYDLEGISLSNGSVRTLFDHKLKNNDIVDLYRSNFNQKIKSDVVVSTNNSTPKRYSINVSGISSYVGSKITAKRKIFKSKSTTYQEINNKFSANIQNSYTDENFNYITSNGFPNYSINPYKKEFSFKLNQIDYETLEGDHNFYDGDLVTVSNYSFFGNYTNPVGVDTGISFYVKRIDSNSIKLSYSSQNVGLSSFINFSIQKNPPVDNTISGFTSSFTLIENQLFGNEFTSAKLFKKFPKSLKLPAVEEETSPGSLAILTNGIDVQNYKSQDKIYYGKIESINVLNSGIDYDLLNPPRFSVDFGNDTTTKLIPSLVGNIKELVVINPGFNYTETPTITISGGGNESIKTEVKMKLQARELEFNSSSTGGFVSDIEDSFIFQSKHFLSTGDRVLYQTLNGSSIGIGTISSEYLIDNSYYHIINVGAGTSFRLAYTKSDALLNNYIQIREYGSGTQRFVSVDKKLVIDSVNLIKENTQFKYRKIFCDSTGMNHYDNIVTIKNHGFLDNDEVVYSYSGTSVSNLSTNTYYYIKKLDNDRFRLKSSKTSSTYVNFGTPNSNSVYYFEYSPIRVNVSGSLYVDSNNNVLSEKALIKPIVLGYIDEVFVEPFGLDGYGFSSILNLQNSPNVKEVVGSNVNLQPLVVDGKIIKVIVKSTGSNYFNSIRLVVEGSGYGAKLDPVIVDGKITAVSIVNSGIGYDSSTTIKVESLGKNLKVSANLQSWNVNQIKKLKESNIENGVLLGNFNSIFGNTFGIFYLNADLYSQFDIPNLLRTPNNKKHSPIIGWSYDGCPIYGPDGFTNVDGTGGISRMTSSYRVKSTLDSTRPNPTEFLGPNPIYPKGFFVEDYEYVEGLGSLDVHNGRFCVTPEFPNGVYAYFCTVTNNNSAVFPYFIGNTYKLSPEKSNFDKKINQNIDFNQLPIIKHTLPYGVENKENYYEYFNFNQKSNKEDILITNTSRGKVDSIQVVTGGKGYLIGDDVFFDDSNTSGSGAFGRVSELSGVGINSIYSYTEIIPNVTLTYKNNTIIGISTTTHNIKDGNFVSIAGISSASFSDLEGFVKVNVPFIETRLTQDLLNQTTTGIVTSIKVKDSILNFEIDSLIKIISDSGSETLKVIGLDLNNNAINVLRQNGSPQHTAATSKITLLQSQISFDYNNSINLPNKNETYYFNPLQSVSVGISTAVGAGNTLSILPLGYGVSMTEFLPNGRIFLPNHNFISGEKVTYDPGQNPIQVSGVGNLNSISDLYVVKINENVIGLTSSKSSINSTDNLLLYTSAENNYLHKFKTDRSVVTSDIITNKTIVSTRGSHNLSVGDVVYLNILSGITTTHVVSYNSSTAKLRLNSQNNPKIEAYENEIVVFDLSSTTLSNTKFKLYSDENFTSEYLGNSENGLEVVRTNNSLTLKISKYTPRTLYYNIESSSKKVFSDETVFKYNTITISPSLYNNINSGITTNTSRSFEINLPGIPEDREYNRNNSILSYSIVSSDITGPVKKVKLVSKGNEYEKLPKIGKISGNGTGCNLIATSNSIGKILNYSVVNNEFVLPSDKTLKPFSDGYSAAFVYDNYQVKLLNILERGANYLSPPQIKLYSEFNRSFVKSFESSVILKSGSVDSIILINPGYGLKSSDTKIVFTENDNGLKIIGLSAISTPTQSLVTLTLKTPSSGFTTSNLLPFAVGDEVFVEGVESLGNGFNSEDYGYEFFEVVGVQTAFGSQDSAQITYKMNDSSGIFILQSTLDNNAYVVNSNILPKVSVELAENVFFSGEKVSDTQIIKNADNDPITNLIKLQNPTTIKVNNILTGNSSKSKGKVSKIEKYNLKLKSSSSVPTTIGWKTQQGNLSSIVQRLSDNDYYQKFSYSLRSKKQLSDWNSIVSDLSHVSGYKKFSDLIIESEASDKSFIKSDDSSNVNVSLNSYVDVNTINDYDLVLENVDDYNRNASDIIKFNSKILTDYLLSKENLVLSIDDISNLFDTDLPKIVTIPVDEITSDIVTKYLFFIQSSNSFFGAFENPLFFELLLTRNKENVTLVSYSYYENNNIGKIQAEVVDNDTIIVNYVPLNPFNTLSIRALREDANFNVGIVTTSYGYTRNVAITTSYSAELLPSQKVIYSIPLSESSSGTLFVGISSVYNIVQESCEIAFLYNSGRLESNLYSNSEIVNLGSIGISTSGSNLLITYDGIPGVGVTVYSNITLLVDTLTSPNEITDTLTRLNSSEVSGAFSADSPEIISIVSADYGASKYAIEVSKTIGPVTQKSFVLINSIHYQQESYLNNINYSIIGNFDDLEFNTIYDLSSNSYVLAYTPSENATYTIKFFEKNILSIRT
jgi:hypothetical protein